MGSGSDAGTRAGWGWRWLIALGAVSLLGCKDGPRAAPPAPAVAAGTGDERGAIIDHEVKTLDGAPMSLADFRGSALLIVNTASQCGYTPQYESLQRLHERYEGRGLHVLAFPCNDFGGQEPGDAKTIREYLSKTYGVTFPVFEKQRIKAPSAEKSPLWRTLTEAGPERFRGEVKWNFTKFLVSPEGHIVGRWGSNVDPLDAQVIAAIDAQLPRAK